LALSHAQQRLGFLDQLAPGSTAYVMSSAALLQGELDVNALEACLTEIVRRHESLRTVFESRDGYPHQVIREPAPVSVPVRDLTGLQAEDRTREAERLTSLNERRSFDLAIGPLFRIEL